jgi:hypothetical protein
LDEDFAEENAGTASVSGSTLIHIYKNNLV